MILLTAIASFQSAASLHIKGSYRHDTNVAAFDLDLLRPLQGVGTVTPENAKKRQVVIIGDESFQYADGLTNSIVRVGPTIYRLTGERWIVASIDDLEVMVDSQRLVDSLFPSPVGLKLGASEPLDGTMALPLANDGVSLLVSADPMHRPLRLLSGPGPPNGDFQQFDVRFTAYGQHVDVKVPDSAVDVTDPMTFPAIYIGIGTPRVANCDSKTICANAIFQNIGGRGQGVVLFRMLAPDASELARCTAAIPELKTLEQFQVSCNMSSAGPSAYAASHPGTSITASAAAYNRLDPDAPKT